MTGRQLPPRPGASEQEADRVRVGIGDIPVCRAAAMTAEHDSGFYRPAAGHEVGEAPRGGLGGDVGRGLAQAAGAAACSLLAMPDDELDPGASTQMFQAFMDRPEPEASGSGWMRPALALAALVIVLALALLLLGG